MDLAKSDTTSRGITGASAPPPVIRVAAILALGLVTLPLAGLLQRAGWSALGADLNTPETREALRLSIITSIFSAGLAVLLGTPLAWVLARGGLPGRSVLRAIVLLPMVLPPVVGGVALLSALSRRSLVGGWLYDVFGVQFTFSTLGVVIAGTFVAMPFFVLTVEGALRGIDPRFEDAAASLGGGSLTVFWRVIVPQVRPAMVAGAVLAWARALGEFGATVTFAGNIGGRTRTLPLAIYLNLDSDPDAAVAMSLVLVAVSLAVLVGLRDRWLTPK